LDHQNNYASLSIDDNTAKSFNILATSWNVLYNFDSPQTKLFSNLYLAKFLDTSAKLFFPWRDIRKNGFAEKI